MNVQGLCNIFSGKNNQNDPKSIVKIVHTINKKDNLVVKKTIYDAEVSFWGFHSNSNHVIVSLLFESFTCDDYKALKLLLSAYDSQNANSSFIIYLVDSDTMQHFASIDVFNIVIVDELPTIAFETSVKQIRYKFKG